MKNKNKEMNLFFFFFFFFNHSGTDRCLLSFTDLLVWWINATILFPLIVKTDQCWLCYKHHFVSKISIAIVLFYKYWCNSKVSYQQEGSIPTDRQTVLRPVIFTEITVPFSTAFQSKTSKLLYTIWWSLFSSPSRQ